MSEGLETISIRSRETGRIEFEVLGETAFSDVPESPYYHPMPGFWLSTRAWMDEDGQHVIVAHDCREKRIVHILPWPTWQACGVHGDEVLPSYSCDGCGIHDHLTIDWDEAPASPAAGGAGGGAGRG